MFSENHDHVCSAPKKKHKDGHMQNFKHKEDLGNTQRSNVLCHYLYEQRLLCMQKTCIFYLCSSHIRCWATSTWDFFLIQKIQECIWKEKCWHLVRTSTIWLHIWSWKMCATSIWTHLQLVTRWTHDALTIHQWKSCERVFSTFQIPSQCPNHVYKKRWLLANVCWLSWFEPTYIKNWYPLPLISRLLDQLRHTKVYTKIDLHGTYNMEHIQEGNK
jgi:hypothetical protein